MKLIVGLGNPGRLYENNRHNIGFICLNRFAKANGLRFDKKHGKARTGAGDVAGVKIVLAKPQTYMNSSGESVSLLVNKFNVDLDDLIIVHDDLDLPLGKIRIRRGGSSGGHKGINSIIDHLGSQDFIRVRVGIGRPEPAQLDEKVVMDYVLSDFTSEEKSVIAEVVPRVKEALNCLITEGLVVAMNRYN